jgi:hypothetical protein
MESIDDLIYEAFDIGEDLFEGTLLAIGFIALQLAIAPFYMEL